jgi:hypothetical protein
MVGYSRLFYVILPLITNKIYDKIANNKQWWNNLKELTITYDIISNNSQW